MGHLLMSDKERQRKAWMTMVCEGSVKLNKAAEAIDVSYRQAKRIYRRFLDEGDFGLTHRSRQCHSNRQHVAKEIILSLYRLKYMGFGPTLAAEKLAEEGHIVDHETLRRWLIEKNLWIKEHKRRVHHPKRNRRMQFGELVQMDGSIHDWFSTGNYECLINMVDDATGKSLSHLEEGETSAGVLRALWRWVEKYGIPMAIYVDLKNVYVSRKEGNLCDFERACKKLGIQIIKAYSPQAKGRVERNHAVYQDRFVKELKLKNITTIEGANKILDDYFIEQINKKFSKEPVNANSAHRPVRDIDLDQVFCHEETRQLQNDFTISFSNQIYKLKKSYGSFIAPKVNIIVRRHLNNTLSFWFNNERLMMEDCDNKPTAVVIKHPTVKRLKLTHSQLATLNKPKTPWSRDSAELFIRSNNSKCYKGLYLKKGHFH